MRAEKEAKMKGAQKVENKPKGVMGAMGKVVVGMAPPANQGKSKSALRREKAKQKKDEEDARRALEEKLLTEVPPAATSDEPSSTNNDSTDPEKRGRKIKKTLKQIEELKGRDQASLNDDQKRKIESEKELVEELASLGIQ